MKILLVEDEPQSAFETKKRLMSAYHTVDTVSKKSEVLFLLNTTHYDCILLDLILQEENGLEICQAIRAKHFQVPILIYSILDDPYTKVLALEIGADDMIYKHVDSRELFARIQALTRRKEKPIANTILSYKSLRLDQKNKTVTIHDQIIELSPKEFQVLALFMQVPDKVFSREEILEQVWDMYVDPFTNKVDVYITFLRKKIHKHNKEGDQYLQTVRGFGYRLAWK